MDTSFLHNHPEKEIEAHLDINDDHVIVDKKDWEIIRTWLKANPAFEENLRAYRNLKPQGPASQTIFEGENPSAIDHKAKTLNDQFERLTHQYEDQLNIEVGEYIGSNTKNPQTAVNKVLIRNLARLMASLAK